MGKSEKKQKAEETKVDPLAESQKAFDLAKEKFDDITTSPDSTQEEKDAVKAEFDEAKQLHEAIKSLQLAPPSAPSSETRKYFTISCLWAHGRYPKLNLKFTNGIAVVNAEQYAAAKESKLWNREIFDGAGHAHAGSGVKVVKESQ